MHVKSKRSFNLLKLLRLDQSKFGPARILINLNEKLAQLCQDLVSLRRCRQHGIFPHCIQRSVRLQFSLRSSPSLQRFMENTRRVLLTRLIRDKHAGIFQKNFFCRWRTRRNVFARINSTSPLRHLENLLSDHAREVKKVLQPPQTDLMPDKRAFELTGHIPVEATATTFKAHA